MMGFTFPGGDETERLNTLIRAQRTSLDKSDIEVLLAAAKTAKPWADFDSFTEDLRLAYNRDHEARLRAKLAKRFPKTAADIPSAPVDVVTETAEIDAQLYRAPPERWLEHDGDRLGADDPRSLAFAKMVARAHLDSWMLEVERVTCCAQTCFVRAHWAQDASLYNGVQRLVLRLFWPSQVSVVVNPAYPDRLQAARFVILKIAGTGSDTRLEIWQRLEVEGEAPRWRSMRVNEDGKNAEPWVPYEGEDLPIVKFHVRPTSTMFAPPSRTLMATQDLVNTQHSDFWYTRGFGAHKQLAVTGTKNKDGQFSAIGPDKVFTTEDENATVTLLDFQTDLSSQTAIDQALVLHGRTNRQPVDAWWTKSGNPETGVARRVRNEYADQKRAEHGLIFVEAEGTMLRVLARITDTFGDLDDIDAEGITYHVRYPEPELMEDPSARAARVKLQLDAGLISRARAAVMMDLYASEADAARAGLSTTIKAPTTPTPPPAPEAPTAADGADEPEPDDPIQA